MILLGLEQRRGILKILKISMKLLMPHIFILVLLVSCFIISLVSTVNTRKQMEAIYDGPYAVKSTAGALNEALETLQTSVYRAISNDSQLITDEAIMEARNSGVILQEEIARLKQYTLGDLDALSRLEESLSELAPMQEYVLALAAESNYPEALAYMEKSNVPVINEAQRELVQYVRSVDAKEQELVAALRQTERNAIALLLALGAVGILSAVRNGTYFWRLYKEEDRSEYGNYI